VLTTSLSLAAPLPVWSGDETFRSEIFGPGRNRPVVDAGGSFIVAPSRGPLHEHHTLVCSRRSRTGIFDMSDPELRELGHIVAVLERVFERRHGKRFVAFENGTSGNGHSGCSIRQYHLHIVPLLAVADLASAAGGAFLAVDGLQAARSVAHELGDYLLLKAPGSPYLMRRRGDEPSQHMRRVVAGLNGVDRWDWRHARDGEDEPVRWLAFEELAVELRAELDAVADSLLPRDATSAQDAMPAFWQYRKVQGMLECSALSLPTLPGIFVDPSVASADDAAAAARCIDPRSWLVRHDRARENGRYHQGGYVVDEKALPSELAWYASLGRVVVLLAPADPLDNLWSAAATVSSDGAALAEIVGPGFDASDLNRGNVSPMEWHHFQLNADGDARLVRSEVASNTDYARAKAVRIRKVALKYVLNRRTFDVDDIDDATARTVLANHACWAKPQVRRLLDESSYEQAPARFIEQVREFVSVVSSLVVERAGASLLAFSASQVGNGRETVVWDIVRPLRKYDLAASR